MKIQEYLYNKWQSDQLTPIEKEVFWELEIMFPAAYQEWFKKYREKL